MCFFDVFSRVFFEGLFEAFRETFGCLFCILFLMFFDILLVFFLALEMRVPEVCFLISFASLTYVNLIIP